MKNILLPGGAVVARAVSFFVAALLGGLLAPAPALAQTTPAWQSALAATHATGSGAAETRATAVDPASGAVFVTGTFTGQVTFGSTTLVGTGSGSDAFVARYEPATATWAWAQSAGGPSTDVGNGIATDGTNVYVTGRFTGSVTFFAGQTSPAPVALSGPSAEVFVAAYAAGTGTGQWAKGAGGTGADIGYGVATDGTNVYVTGQFNASATFFAGQTSPAPAPVALGGSGNEVFVAAYATGTGTGQWAKRAGGTGTDIGYGVATDGTNVYVTGQFTTSATFFAGQPSPAPVALNGTGQEVFVAAYAAGTGTGQWARSAGGGNADIGYGVATDGTNVYVTGQFGGSATFFAGQTSPAPVALGGTSGSTDAFVAAYAAGTGTGQWARSAGGGNTDVGYGVATDGASVYVTGYFNASATFFAGQTSPAPAPVALGGTSFEVFVAAYAAGAGTGQWARSAGGTGLDIGYGVAVGSAGVYAGSGTSTGTATFGPASAPPNAAALGTLNKTTGAWQAVAASLTDPGTSQVLATAVDKVSGAVFVTGSFTGQVAFGATVLTSAGSDDGFVARYEPGTATWAWASRAGGTNGDRGQGIATDGTNVYVTGYFDASATFFAGQPAATTLAGTGDEVFVAAYAAGAGTGVWARSAGGSSVDVGNGIATDGTNVYVTGYFSTSAGFFAGQPAAVTLAGGGPEVFVAAYAAGTGTGVWARSAGSSGSNFDQGNGIATDGTNVYVTGYFITSATFFAGQPAATTLAGTGQEVFVAAYGAGAGTGVWARSAGSGNTDVGNGIATDGTNVYVTGYFITSATFFAGQPAAVTLAGTGQEVFVAAYGAGAGTGVWARSAGSGNNDQGRGIATDGTNVYVTGSFVTSADFFAGQPAAVTLAGGGFEAFVAAYAAGAGTGVWARSAGGGGNDAGLGIGTDGRRLYVGGLVGLPATFGAITLPGSTNPAGVLAGLALPPTLASLSATSGAAGSTLGATGSALTGLTGVTFTPAGGGAGTTAASGYTSTATSASGIVVPTGLAVGAYTVRVTNANGTSNGLAFAVTLPLAIVTVSPVPNARNAARTGPVAVTFNQGVTAGSAAALKVFSAQRGGLRSGSGSGSGSGGSTTASGSTVRFAPSYAFEPGETVQATITTAATATAGGSLATARVVEFRAAAGAGPGTFGGGSDLGLGLNTGPYGVAVADVDGDADLDLLTVNSGNNTVSVRLNDGTGAYGGGSDVAVGPNPFSLAVADVDGDGDLDVLTANSSNNGSNGGTVSVRLNDGTGSFAGGTDPVVDDNPHCVKVGDVDGDGDLDLLTVNINNSTVSVRLNNGNGVFGGGADLNLFTAPRSLALGDVDGDGDLDLLVANFSTAPNGNTVGVRLNNGGGGFGGGSDLAVGDLPSDLKLGDVDGDGDLDLLAISRNIVGSGTVSVRLNNGSGVFGGGSNLAVGVGTFYLTVGDVDGDGDLDVLAANFSDNDVSVRLNNGTGTFGSGANVAVAGGPYNLTLGDVDGDGDLDLLTANSNTSTVSVRLNQLLAPTLTTLNPASGPVGTVVALTGTGLTGATAITFGGSSGNVTTTGFTVASATRITGVVVPAGAATGSVTVTTPNGTSNGLTFTVTLPDLTISTGSAGSPIPIAAGTYRNVTITGSGFGQLTGAVTANGAVLVQGTLDTNCQALTGAGSFALAAGATLGICDAGGISASGPTGAVRLTGTRAFSADANYVYNGTLTFQDSGDGLPATVRALVIDNALDIAGGLLLGQALAIRRELRLTRGNLGLFATVGGAAVPLTLLSDATGTALVVETGQGRVVGNSATVQRHLTTANPGLGYRHYSSPVSGNNLADLATATFTPVFDAAYNTRATAHPAAGFPTAFGYDQGRVPAAAAASPYAGFDRGWFSPLGGDVLAAGTGYAVNLRGTEVVDFTGTFRTGDVPLSLPRATGSVGGEGLHLVGNPYPAPIDWGRVTAADRPGLDAAFYVFESSGQYTGSYRTAVNGVGSSAYVGSSQGFFVRVSPGQVAGTLTFRNAHRLTDYADQVPVRRGAADTRPLLRLTLAGNGGLSDDFHLYAQAGATAGADAEFDAVKMPNPSGLNLASVTATGAALAIDGRPAFATATVIPLHVAVPAAGRYALTAAALANLAGTTATLVDNLTGTRTVLAPGATYAFGMSAPTAPGRFWLNLAPASGPLAAAANSPIRQLTTYPNPTTGRLTVLRPAGAAATGAVLLNALGQTVRTLALPTAETALDLRGLATGIYTLRLTLDGQPVSKRVVLE